MSCDIRIVIGSWGSYNECNERALGSKWLDLSDYSDWDEIVEELEKEGFELNGIDEKCELLHHCVGRMGYDQKFILEETLIFFIRTKEKPVIPFVTVEYSLKDRKILQCYGDHDSKPDENVINFVNKMWLPYAKKQTRKLQNCA